MRKIFSIIFSLILLFSLLTTNAYAFSFPFNGDYFIKSGNNDETAKLIDAIDNGLINDEGDGSSKKSTGLGNGLEAILVLLYQIGDVVAVCVFIYFGIMYLLATPQKKADLKASMYPYFVGLLLYIVGVPIAISIINIFINVF